MKIKLFLCASILLAVSQIGYAKIDEKKIDLGGSSCLEISQAGTSFVLSKNYYMKLTVTGTMDEEEAEAIVDILKGYKKKNESAELILRCDFSDYAVEKLFTGLINNEIKDDVLRHSIDIMHHAYDTLSESAR